MAGVEWGREARRDFDAIEASSRLAEDILYRLDRLYHDQPVELLAVPEWPGWYRIEVGEARILVYHYVSEAGVATYRVAQIVPRIGLHLPYPLRRPR